MCCIYQVHTFSDEKIKSNREHCKFLQDHGNKLIQGVDLDELILSWVLFKIDSK